MSKDFPSFEGLTPAQMAAKLEAHRKNLRLLYMGYGAVWLVILLLYFVDMRAMIVLGLANLCVGFFFVSPQHKAYKRNLLHGNLLVGLGKDIAGISHHTVGALTNAQMDAVELVPPYKKGFLAREQVTGTLSGMPVTLADITAPYEKAENGKVKISWVSGCMTVLQLPMDTGLNIRIVDRDFFPYPDRVAYFVKQLGMTALSVTDERFQENFTLYCKDNTYELPHGMIKRLISLRDYTPGQLGISLQGDRLTVFIKRRFLGVPSNSIKAAITEQALGFSLFPELHYILEIARYLH